MKKNKEVFPKGYVKVLPGDKVKPGDECLIIVDALGFSSGEIHIGETVTENDTVIRQKKCKKRV